jgi:hypothetical protein
VLAGNRPLSPALTVPPQPQACTFQPHQRERVVLYRQARVIECGEFADLALLSELVQMLEGALLVDQVFRLRDRGSASTAC